jgi:hypothetical protein
MANMPSTSTSSRRVAALPTSSSVFVPIVFLPPFSLDTGQLSEVVSTSFGYHIIRVEDRKQAERIAFEEAKKDVRENLLAQEVDTIQLELQEKYPVRIDEELWTSFIEENPIPDD